MLLSLIDLDKQDQEIKHLIANLEDKENLRRELFIHQATMDDSAVRFYTGIPSLTYLMASYSILKPAAEKWSIGWKEKVTKQENTRRVFSGAAF